MSLRPFLRLACRWCALVLAAAATSGCGRESPSSLGPSPSLTYAVFGSVSSETGNVLAGAEVRVADGAYAGKRATTDALGAYRLDGLDGAVRVVSAKTGYETAWSSVTVAGGDHRVDFRMRRAWGTLSGRTSDAVDGSAVGGVQVRDAAGAETTSAEDGAFWLPLPPANTVLTLSRGGYWTRQVNLQADSDKPAGTDLLPVGKGFDLNFFDYIFRQQYGGTVRWVQQPAIEVWTQEFACEVQNHGMPLCTRIRATGVPAPASFIDNVKAVIASDLAEYTGGVIQAPLTVRTHAPGTILHGSTLVEEGVISFAYVNSGLHWPEGSGATYGTRAVAGATGGGVLVKGHIQIHDADKRDRSVVSHELAHTLGFFHPKGYDAVPLPSCMKSRIWDRPTDADKMHGRILYRRPAGNRSPDTDPSGVFANRVLGPVEMHVIR